MLERNYVANRFEALFDCPTSEVTSEYGGYQARGCGVVAHFACIDTDDDHAGEYRSLGQELLASLIEEVFEEDQCVLEHARRLPPPKPATAESLVSRYRHDRHGVVVRARIGIGVPGTFLVAVAAPERLGGRVWLVIRGTRLRDTKSCSPSLYRDGDPIQVLSVAALDEGGIAMRISADALRNAHLANRIAGDVCGISFEIADLGRKALTLFEARFREEMDRTHRTKGAGSTP
jgi:hypothetical protein